MNQKAIDMNLRYYSDYFIALFWSEIEENEDIQDSSDLSVHDINKECLLKQFKQLDEFFEKAESILDETDYTHDQACHDFLLTRQGHGVGFWEADHCTKEQGETLTEIAQQFNTMYFSASDGVLYID